jgi:hypothetical protein
MGPYLRILVTFPLKRSYKRMVPSWQAAANSVSSKLHERGETSPTLLLPLSAGRNQLRILVAARTTLRAARVYLSSFVTEERRNALLTPFSKRAIIEKSIRIN